VPNLSPSVIWALLVAFVATLAAVCYLIVTNHDPQTLVTVGVTIAGVFGLGVHQAATSKVVAKIDAQTNGVLDQRIQDNVNAVLDARAVTIKTKPAK
jgi:hypothetical protein